MTVRNYSQYEANDHVYDGNLCTKILISSTRDPKSTIGEDMRKENVTPKGKPADVKPMKSGIDEHEQNGVTVPSRAAITFAPMPRKRPNIFLLRSGENNFVYS